MASPDDERARPDWETPLPILTGRAWAFGMRLASTDVLPVRFANAEPSAARHCLFADVDCGLARQIAPGDVVVADEHEGGDAVAAPALAALHAAGVVVLVGRRFAPAVERCASAHGIITIVLDAPAFIHTGDRLRIDLEDAKVVNLSSGDRAAIRNLDAGRRAALRGLLGIDTELA